MFLKKVRGVALALTLGISIVGCSKAQPKDVAAEVNGTKIPMTEFYEQYAAKRNNTIAMGGEETLQQKTPDGKMTMEQYIQIEVLDSLIQQEIILQDAANSKVEVTDEEAKKIVEDFKTNVGGEEAFKEGLSKVNLTEEFYTRQLRNEALLKKYVDVKLKEFTPKDEDIKKYYDEHKDDYFTAKASHILVADLQEANKIRKEVQKGGDFAKIAKEKSLDPGSKENGGELGEFNNGAMVPEFNDAVKEMKVGEIHEPIKTQFGYHVIKLEDKKAREFDDALKEELKQKITQEKFTEYIQKLEKDAKVKKYIDTKKDIELPEEYKSFGLNEEALKIQEEAKKAAESAEKDEKANANAEKNTKETKTEEKK